MKPAYYNEIDPNAAAWLRELIRAGHIAPGDVDTRSIEDVVPADLAGFGQCHFFAGIGGWSLALRRAGWPDDRPVWTGSCPCQPFSAAGKRKGTADERHLWPAFFHLIRQRRPVAVFGEQVASKDGLAWLDLVSSDLEGEGYACGAVDTCAAGFGAPHIRQRLYWVGYTESGRGWPGFCDSRQNGKWRNIITDGSTACGLGNASSAGLEGYAGHGDGKIGRPKQTGSASEAGRSRGVEDACVNRRHARGQDNNQDDGRQPGATGERFEPGPTDGFWRAADWLFCRDGRWRPVEPGTFPLAHGIPSRVVKLRGFGNAINVCQAKAFIEAWLEILEAS